MPPIFFSTAHLMPRIRSVTAQSSAGDVDCPARVNTLEACPDKLVTVAATAMQMQKQTHQATIDETKRATEYLANERTFLAWVRTSVAVMSLGFVLARFSVWLRELSVQGQTQAPVHRGGISLPIGVAMMI